VLALVVVFLFLFILQLVLDVSELTSFGVELHPLHALLHVLVNDASVLLLVLINREAQRYLLADSALARWLAFFLQEMDSFTTTLCNYC